MRISGTIAFAAAAACHVLLLFGFHAGGTANPAPIGISLQTVDVTLMGAIPENAPVEAPSTAQEPTENNAPNFVSMPEPPATLPTAEIHPEPSAPVETDPSRPATEPAPGIPMTAPEPRPTAHPATAAYQPMYPANPRESETLRPASPLKPIVPTRHATTQGHQKQDPSSGSTSKISQPRYRSNPPPRYPEEARRNAQQGVVLVSVQVEKDGRPSRVTLQHSSGFPLLDAAALESVRKWTFTPAQAGGLPAASRIAVPVRFALENR